MTDSDTQTETWKPIPGYPFYEASDITGRSARSPVRPTAAPTAASSWPPACRTAATCW